MEYYVRITVEEKDSRKPLFCEGHLAKNYFPEEAKKPTKYGLKTFNTREQNLNLVLIINLLLLATKCDKQNS
jgi:hypothetical protein